MMKKSKRYKNVSASLAQWWNEDVDDWDDLEETEHIERIRKLPREQSQVSDEQAQRRHRQKEAGRDFQRLKRERLRESNGTR